MIQVKTQTDFTFYIQVIDNKIGDTPQQWIAYLFKFTNDMSGEITYCYQDVPNPNITNRYGEFTFKASTTTDVYNGQIHLEPSGYYKYEVFQVDWSDVPRPNISFGFAPVTEFDILLPASGAKGVVMGLVTKGKMLVSDIPTTKQVTYKQHLSPSGTNYIWSGQ